MKQALRWLAAHRFWGHFLPARKGKRSPAGRVGASRPSLLPLRLEHLEERVVPTTGPGFGNHSLGSADLLVVATQPPSRVVVGSPGISFRAVVENATGAVDTSFNGPITVRLGSGTTGAMLGGPTQAQAVHGVVLFTGLTVDRPGSGYTLALTASGATSTSTGPFTASLFADPNLEAAVQNTLGLPATHLVTQTDLLGLTALTADSNKITNLTGLQYATHLQSFGLLPSDWSVPGHITSLVPLSHLIGLHSLTLVDAGITNGELPALSALTGLQSLDLRYDPITSIASVAGLPSLTSLHIYGDPVTDLSPLAGKLVTIDLPTAGASGATTIPALAAALDELPIQIYQYVLNNFAYQPYAGAKKGAQATLETRAGNDWDLSSLLAGLLGQAGVATRYDSGRIDVPIPIVMNWLGVTSPLAAVVVLGEAGLNPTVVHDPILPFFTDFQFDHTWLDAQVHVPGAGLQWVSLDPSWKFKDFQPGVSVASLVPFDEATYLAQPGTVLPYQFYESQVAAYLAANQPGVSTADVPHDGPIHAQLLTALPTGLPYSVETGNTTSTQVPTLMTYRVGLTLKQGSTTLFSQVLVVPQMSLERVTVGYAPAAGGQLTPELLLDGQVVAQGPAVAANSAVALILDQYDPGSSTPDQSFEYDRLAGQYLAVGLDAGQLGDAYLASQQQAVNAAAIAARDGASFTQDDQVGAFLALGVATYFASSDKAYQVIDGLTGAVPVYNFVGSGVATAGTTVNYFSALQNPYLPSGPNVDIKNAAHLEVALDGNTANDTMRETLLGDEGSDEESATWELMTNTPSISTIKSLQLANQRGIPIFTINSSNEATLIPQLTLDPSTIATIQSYVNSGGTVIVPRDPTPLNDWQGVGFIERNGTSVGYIIAGGLASQASAIQGGSVTTNTPDGVNTQTGSFPNWTGQDDPVNIANGNVTQDETDLQLPGIGLSLSFQRHYDSQSSTDRGLGVGWSFNYGDFLTVQGDQSVVWTDSQGRRYTFTPDGHGGYTVPTTLFGTFTASASGYAFRDRTGLVHQFDTSGRLTEISDRNGNALVIAYDVSGHIKTVTEADAPNEKLFFVYTGSHITSVSDGTGRTWSYVDSGNELVEVDAPFDATTPKAVERYSYYTDTALGGLLKQVTLPNGGVTLFTYYGNRRAYQVTDPGGNTGTFVYNLFTNQTAYINANDQTTTDTYNSAGELIARRYPNMAVATYVWQNDLKVADTDVYGQTETFQYDTQGNVVLFTDRAGNVVTTTYDPTFSNVRSITEPGGRVTTFQYDTHGNLVKETDALGDVTTMTVDAHGLMLTQTSPRGNASATPALFTTTYTYNAAGQVLTETTHLSTQTFSYDTRGHLVSATDPDGHTTTYVYNLLDELTQTTNALGGKTVYVHDAIGSVIATTDPLGRTTRYVYDPLRRLVKTIEPDGSILLNVFDAVGNLLTRVDELGRAIATIFDAENRPVQTLYADGSSTETGYDGGGRVVRTTDEDGNTTTDAYDVLGRLVTTTDALAGVTARTYDAVGNLTAVTDPLARTTTYQYDLLNRRVAVIDPLNNTTTTAYDADGNVASTTDPLHQATVYTYDVIDRLTETTDPLGQTTARTYDAASNLLSITDPAGNKTSYTYDALNRMATQTNAVGAKEHYAYDADGNVISTTDFDGRTIRYQYDVRNDKVVEQWLDTSGNPIRTIRSSFDPAGELTAASDPSSSYRYTYDLRGRVLEVDNAGTPGSPHVIVSNTYDPAGNLLTVYDLSGGVAHPDTFYRYDALNRVTRINLMLLTYDADGELLTLSRYADGGLSQLVVKSTYGYDSDGRMTSLTETTTSSTLAQFQWSYDADSRISQAVTPDGTTTYQYDADSQVVAANTGGPGSESYSYGTNGNRTNAGYQTGAGNRLLSDGVNNYKYDNEGNLIQSKNIATGAVTLYTSDYRNRLTGVVEKDAAGHVTMTATYTYDVFNRRIGKTIDPDGAGPLPATVQRYVYSGNNLSLQFDGSGNLTFHYIYGPGGQVLASVDGSSNVLWALGDNLGSIRYLVDNSANVVDHIVYNSFGQVTAESNAALDFLFGYIGRQLDRETGLLYDGARYYSPADGRFISQDPLSFLAGDVDLYRYGGNDPVNVSDPSGLMGWGRNGSIFVGGRVSFFVGGGGALNFGGAFDLNDPATVKAINDAFNIKSQLGPEIGDTLSALILLPFAHPYYSGESGEGYGASLSGQAGYINGSPKDLTTPGENLNLGIPGTKLGISISGDKSGLTGGSVNAGAGFEYSYTQTNGGKVFPSLIESVPAWLRNVILRP